MPKDKDLKRLVRERMERTGESYTAARAQVTRQGDADRRDYAKIAGMRDEAVRAKTGDDWRGWTRTLDEAGSTSKTHPEIAKWLQAEHDVSPWWAQTITVGYERIRGLRDKNQRRGGGFDANKSKTIPVPIEELYAAFDARKRKRWLEVSVRTRKATENKSLRWTFEDGTPVDVHFWAKGPEKSQVQLQHRELASQKKALEMREFWGERFEALAALLTE